MSTLTGKIKWYNGKKGYGFIERDDKEKDAFVHASAVKAAGMRYLNEGDKLEFALEDGHLLMQTRVYHLHLDISYQLLLLLKHVQRHLSLCHLSQ